ncbi:Holliday junction DNA helicase ruvB N-terminus [Streptomyces sp. 136MFCol5.1]|uniref:nSTAND3 domain-containing NTPase n=1 Tax=Streptomyces sp. 136MFCol5.1 TaxID=1172182 RepID=UPI000888FB4D|nr:restriction endonuclease [Streptomyces sp. 136MFCol5.1]SCZ08871.1 Holliday junction DNA helicase ruvB N-terminus [Streptomyces sp. 136MFCol5.1]
MRDFSVLSDVEFEDLVGDLLAAEMQVHVERFSAGADGGIDLRWQNEGLCVAQCKHYRNSSFSQLLASAKKEIPKVEKISPRHYQFATSFDLSVGQKGKIYDLFKSRMEGPEDVIGLRDIDAMLTRHSNVESCHPKLWVTTGMQLFWHLHSDIAHRTQALRSRIEKAVPRYVVHPAYEDARSLITQHNVCLISGPPGIGKTTLAQMLLAEHISIGYEPIEVSSDINEAWTALTHDTKQIFLYDDFLGQISFSERLPKNEDKRISDLIERISGSSNKKLVLTTREYILRDAKRSYEKLYELDDRYQFVLEVKSYRRSDRAQILYNHLWNSDISSTCLREIATGGYKRIIDHAGYNPRVIEYCTNAGFDTKSPGYPMRFKAILDNPERMWRIAFEKHLTLEQRLLVLVISTLPIRVGIDKLQDAHVAFCKRMHIRSTGTSFRDCLEVLEGTFISIDREHEGAISVRHANPSVTEFATHRIAEDREILQSLIDSAVFFEQLIRLYDHGAGGFLSQGNDDLKVALVGKKDSMASAMLRTYESDSPHDPEQWVAANRLRQGVKGKIEDRARFYFRVDHKFDIGSKTLEWIASHLASHWRSGNGSKLEAARVFEEIAQHRSSEEFIDELHDAYHDWLRSTLDDVDDWNMYLDHLREFEGAVDIQSDSTLVAEFEALANGELDERAPYELDLDGMKSIAADFKLEHLASRITEALEEGGGEPDYDDYERSSTSAEGDERESDDYIEQLFGRFTE